jgi:hypothetical protein
MRQFQIQACVLFERPHPQEELFDESIPFTDDTTEEEAKSLADEPLIGYYTTRYVTAMSVAEAVHYVEEALTTDEDLPQGRIFDVSCTEIRVEDVERETREEASNPDVPGIWYEEGLGFFSQIEIERPHTH